MHVYRKDTAISLAQDQMVLLVNHLCPLASGKLATEAFPVQPGLDTFP